MMEIQRSDIGGDKIIENEKRVSTDDIIKQNEKFNK